MFYEEVSTHGIAAVAKVFVPRLWQPQMIQHLVEYKRCSLFVPMGAGKSVAVLTALEKLNQVEDVYPCLIVGPLRVAQSVWPQEAKEWDHTQHLRVRQILGDPVERRCAINMTAEIFTINFENIPWLVGELKGEWPFKTLVIDEVSRLKGYRSRQGTQRARALMSVAFKSKRAYGLSGTPASNGLKDLWGPLYFLDQGERLGRTYSSFTGRWFRPDWSGFGIEPLPHAQKEIEERIKDICLSIEMPKLDAPVVNKIYVDIPYAARKAYKEMERQMYTELQGEEIEAFNAAAKTNKLLQFSNGISYVGENSEKWIEVHDAKIEALRSVIEESAGAPVLVAYHFKADLERLKKAFPKARVLDKNPKTIEEWNAGKIDILLLHPASAGHGISLQHGGNILVFFSVNWNLEEFLQVVERIGPMRQKQSGYNRNVYLHYILLKDSIEDAVMERLEGKKSVQEALLTAMRKLSK